MPEQKISAKDFVIAWNQSADLEEVAEKTGLKLESARSRARTFVANGVGLKKLTKRNSRGGVARNDYAALNAIAAQHLGESELMVVGTRNKKKGADAEPEAVPAEA